MLSQMDYNLKDSFDKTNYNLLSRSTPPAKVEGPPVRVETIKST